MSTKLVNILNEIEHDKTYCTILKEHIKECKKRINLINCAKITRRLKDFVKNYPDFIKLMKIDVNKDICHISNNYNSLEHHVQYHYCFQIGLMTIRYEYVGDDRGWGRICVDVNGFKLSRRELSLEHLDNEELSGIIINLIQSGINNINENDEDIISRFIMDICKKDYNDWFEF